MTKPTQQKELSDFEWGEIIGAWKCKISERKIAEASNKPNSTVHNVIVKYTLLGVAGHV